MNTLEQFLGNMQWSYTQFNLASIFICHIERECALDILKEKKQLLIEKDKSLEGGCALLQKQGVPKTIGGEGKARSFYQTIPGFAVMFLLFSILGGSGKLIDERNNKTLRRILVSTTKRRDLIIGKWIGMSLQGFMQSLILFLVGALLFGISLGNPIYLIIFIMIAALCTGAISVFIASISKSLAQATGFSMLLFMVMSH
ncbi:MAG TPA: ABC transporter permease [Lachnospiraceae bacterium]|nr:ABC transporter permease [Lachnospiraceae bacterium]